MSDDSILGKYRLDFDEGGTRCPERPGGRGLHPVAAGDGPEAVPARPEPVSPQVPPVEPAGSEPLGALRCSLLFQVNTFGAKNKGEKRASALITLIIVGFA